jgi:hypothetical protein
MPFAHRLDSIILFWSFIEGARMDRFVPQEGD